VVFVVSMWSHGVLLCLCRSLFFFVLSSACDQCILRILRVGIDIKPIHSLDMCGLRLPCSLPLSRVLLGFIGMRPINSLSPSCRRRLHSLSIDGSVNCRKSCIQT